MPRPIREIFPAPCIDLMWTRPDSSMRCKIWLTGKSGEPHAAGTHLYRFAREAVINANKHAQAREIIVKLQRSRRQMVLHVIDDGVGLSDERKLKQGLGLHIMNYRAQLMGGRLEIDSQKSRGTRVSCYLPSRVSPSRNAKHGEQPAELTETAPSSAAAAVPSFRHLKRQGAAIG